MRRNDIILITFLLAASFMPMVIISAMSTEGKSKEAVIRIGNREAYRIPINDSKEARRVSFEFSGNTGYLDIKDGAVKMEEMERTVCPERICSETGWISKSYEAIVCLPNKIVVSIESSKGSDVNESSVDGISY